MNFLKLLAWIGGFAFVTWGGVFGLLALLADPFVGIIILSVVFIVAHHLL